MDQSRSSRGWPLPAPKGWRRLAHRLFTLREDRAQRRNSRPVRRMDMEPARTLRLTHPRGLSVRDVFDESCRRSLTYWRLQFSLPVASGPLYLPSSLPELIFSSTI